MSILQADPTKDWRDLTDEHRTVRKELENTVEVVKDGKHEDPAAVVGPYRAGKTQLLYHTFRHAWQSGVPALYTDALTLFKEFRELDEEDSNSDDISSWIEKRVEEQISAILDGKDAEWLPNWGTKRERKEWQNNLDPADFEGTDYHILLVDEVEQAYTKLRQLIEEIAPLDTDDRNPLRIILDDTEGVYQVWGFGLVSAYEFRGEADAGRFKEFRLPIVSPNEIADQLSSQDKSEKLATGIWWLSRGRIGWINKFVRECPNDPDQIGEWVQQVGSYDFDATNPLNRRVFELIDGEGPEIWDEARRAILLLPDGYPKWTISESQPIPVEAAQQICAETVSREIDIGVAAKEIIERNSGRLTKALSPASTWIAGDQYLPRRLLFKKSDAQSFLNLLTNLIISFEGRTEARSEAVEAIDEIDIDTFHDSWLERVYDFIQDDVEKVWAIKPSVIEEGYPPVAVNPSRLSESTSDEIIGRLDSGIEIQTGVSGPYTDVKVKFCPSQDIFNQEAQAALEPRDLQQTTALIIPEEERDNWELNDEEKTMEKHGRISVEPRGAKRFWDFILQLNQYFENKDIQMPITEQRIQDAIDQSNHREERNTIHTLYEQVEKVVKEITRNRVSEFSSRYSLTQDDTPIWGKSNLNSDIPYWSWGGSANIPRTGLSYVLVLSERTVSEKDQYVFDLREHLMDAYDEDYLSDRTEFKFKEFLDLVFTSTSLSAQTRKERNRFGVSSKEKPLAVMRFRDYAWDLATSPKEEGHKANELVSSLMQMEPIDGRENGVNIVDRTSFQNNQASSLLWGALLEKAVIKDLVSVEEKLENLVEDLSKTEHHLEQILNDVSDKNQMLDTDVDGNRVLIKTSELENIHSNVKRVKGSLSSLKNSLEEKKDLRPTSTVFYVITDIYCRLINRSVEEKDGIKNVSLRSVDGLGQSYKKLRSMVEEEDFMNHYSEDYREDAIAWLEEEARSIFNFEAHAGNRRVDIDDLDSLREVEVEARENLNRLNRLLDTAFEIKEDWEKREQLRQESIGDLEGLYDSLNKEEQR